MTYDLAWQALYRAALLETGPEELRPRIDEAERAIRQRIAELRQDDSTFEEERRSLDDALRALMYLEKVECKPATPALLVQTERG